MKNETSLNSAQERAVTSEAPIILCLAGPGSGKTWTLVERLQYKIDCGVNPGGFAVITYTNAAADEIRQRVSNRNHLGECLGYCGTLHGFLLRELERARGQRLTVLDAEREEEFLALIRDEVRYKGTREALAREIAKGPQLLPAGARLTIQEIAACRFFNRLKASNLVTFDLILHQGRDLVVNHPDRIGKYSHLFVDEYQDSGNIDAEIYMGLPIANKFFVGDPDQAIYSFRGGDVENILDLTHNPQVEVICLEDNYRCGQSICQAAQLLIEHDPGRPPKRTRSATGQSSYIMVSPYDTEGDERAGLIRTLLDVRGGEVAVLVRTNWLARQFTQSLTAAGIKIAAKTRRELPPDWAQAKLLLALLNDPENDDLAFWYLDHRHGRREASRARLEANAAGLSVNQHSLKIPAVGLGEIGPYLTHTGVTSASMEVIAQAIGLLPSGANLSELLLALQEIERHEEEIGEGVMVTTVHSAKGREWDVVFLPAFEQEIIPGKLGELEEERRLAFVAITRAKTELHISYAESRTPQFGGPRTATPSQFIQEAGL
jgi:DNA helicase-2/ATP-dependent DNA helicase PcrA